MRNRALLSLAGIVLLLIGVVGGIVIGGHMTAQAAASQRYTVRAGSSEVSKYCATYEQALANDLHVAPSAIEQANIDALTQVLDQMVDEKYLTKVERDQLVPVLTQLGASPCSQLDGKSLQSDLQRYLQGNPLVVQKGLAAHAALTSAVATALHMTPDALASALGKGKTVPQLAKQQGADIASVRTAYLTAAKAFLAQEVSAGDITQAQADSLNKTLASAVAKDSYPLLDLGSLASLGQGQ
jgi:hypothetical protein